jgi:uncharacterized protein (DUF1499 family)
VTEETTKAQKTADRAARKAARQAAKASKPPSKVAGLALTALVVSFLTPLFIVIAMLATAGGQLDYEMGFKTLTLGLAPNMSVIAFGFCLLVLLIAIFKDPKRSGLLALVATLISGGLLGGFYAYGEALKAYPPIADVATDWSRPVTLSNALIKARGPQALAVEDDPTVSVDASIKWARKRIADINAATCPGATPIRRHLDEAAVRKVLEGMGYTITGSAPWRIEALYTDPFFGFEADMVIRLDPDRTDARSISRRQQNDIGGNCARVTKVMSALRKL